MNTPTAFRTLRTVSLCLLVATGLLIVGCDSGGSNGGGGTSGTVTAAVEGGDATGTLSVEFTYSTGDETCSTFAYDEEFGAPGDKEFDPTVLPAVNCSPDAPKQWEEVEVTFNPNSSADGLSLTLTSGGSDLASTSSPNASGNLVATAGSSDDS